MYVLMYIKAYTYKIVIQRHIACVIAYTQNKMQMQINILLEFNVTLSEPEQS